MHTCPNTVETIIGEHIKILSNMFEHAGAFNGDLSHWDVGAVTNMKSSTFRSCAYNIILIVHRLWNEISLLCILFFCCCTAVFENAGAFNGDLSHWDTDAVTNMADSTFPSCAYDCYFDMSTGCGTKSHYMNILFPPCSI